MKVVEIRLKYQATVQNASFEYQLQRKNEANNVNCVPFHLQKSKRVKIKLFIERNHFGLVIDRYRKSD